MEKQDLRLRCLELANHPNKEASEIIRDAASMMAFVEGSMEVKVPLHISPEKSS